MGHRQRFGRLRGSIFAIAVAAVAGCHHNEVKPQCDFIAPLWKASPPPGPVLVPQVPGSITVMPLNAVNITDHAIVNKVVVQATNAKRTPGGDMEVFARVVNCTDYPLQVEGRTHFLDAGQASIEPVTAWSRMHLPARSITNYSERSTRGGLAESYLIELREGR